MFAGVVQKSQSQVPPAAEAAAAAAREGAEIEEAHGESGQQSTPWKKSLNRYYTHARRRGARHYALVNIAYLRLRVCTVFVCRPRSRRTTFISGRECVLASDNRRSN